MRLAASREAVAAEDEFTRRRSSLLRGGFRCLAELLRLPDGFRSLPPARERILPSCLPSRRHDSDHDETAKASGPPLRVRAKRRWKPNRVPSRCTSRIPDRCTACRESECHCLAKIEPMQRVGPPQFLWPVPDSVVFPAPNGEKTHTARDQEEKQLSRRW